MPQGAAFGQHRMRLLLPPVLTLILVSALVLAQVSASVPESKQSHAGAAGKGLNAAEQLQGYASSRKLLQSSYVATACSAKIAATNPAAVQDFASKLLGDSRLQLTAARFTGACSALGIAAFSSTNSLAQQFSTALVLSTGDVTAVVGDIDRPAVALSTNLNQPGDPSIGSYTYDAAVLELDITVQPSSSSSSSSRSKSLSQLLLNYAFASEEYGLPNANPDAVVIGIRPFNSNASNSSSSSSSSSSSLQQYIDLAVLPGASHLPPPGTATAAESPVDVFYNTGYQFNTAWRGFTQVVPSQGFTVTPGSSYTLRLEVADANNGLLDSVLLFPVGSLKLYGAPTAAAGGPYAVAPSGQINLSASKSVSPNGAIRSYLWRITPYGSSTPLITAANPVITVTAPPAGQYNVTLDIWDVIGGRDFQTTALSVDESNVLDWWSDTPVFATPSSLMPRPNAVIAVNGTTRDTVYVKAQTGGAVMLVIDGSQSTDQRGSQLAYDWGIAQTEPSGQQLAMKFPYAEPSKFIYSFDIGTYLISLSVTGPGGISSAQTLVTVAANTPPTAAAGGPYTATVGVPVVVSAAQSSDPDGDPLTYSWLLFNSAGTQIGSYSGQALSMTLTSIGTYTLRLTVTDDRGGSASAVTQIRSLAPVPSPPPPPQQQQQQQMARMPDPLPPPPSVPLTNPAPVPIPPAQPTPPPVITYTPTVIAAVPASPPPSNARLAKPGTAEATYTTQSSPATASGIRTAAAAAAAPAAPTAAGGAAGPAPVPSPAMCLYSKDSDGVVSSLWDSAYDSMDDYNQIDMSLFPTSYWAVCSSSGSGGASSSGSSSGGATSSSSSGSSGGTTGSSSGSSSSSSSGSRTAAVQSTSSTAVISKPDSFTLSNGTATQVYLDATGSTAAAGRSIIAFSWTVQRKPDSAVITKVTGLNTPVWLGPGLYTVMLQTTDTSGQTATAQKDFSIGDAEVTTAVISSPDSFVQNADAGAVKVPLSAVGSKPGPGLSISGYQWLVVRLPDLAAIETAQGTNATVSLPVGSYRVYLAVLDSAGGNGTVTRDFVVGYRAASGASAVITWPPELVQAASANGVTTVALDASGSAAASSGATITQYIWAVVDQATRTAAGNATGRLTTVNLPPGSYQIGLLVMDSQGHTASARKDFTVGSGTGVINNPPIIRAGMTYNGTVGGVLQITGITDPDGDNITVTWALLDQSTGQTATGTGFTILLANLTAGPHLLLITAKDGKGGETTGTAAVTVLPKPGTTVSSTSGTSGQRLPNLSPKPAGTKATIKQLPDLELPQGAVMELDAASFNLLPIGAKLDSYVWEMTVHGTGEPMATVYGRLGRFELSTVGVFDTKLLVRTTSGKEYNSTGSVRVLAPVSPAAALDPWAGFSGSCGPFNAKQYTAATISCPSVAAPGAKGGLYYSWKLISPGGSIKPKNGSEVSFVGLEPGHYRVEVSVAIGEAPTSQNTAYFTSTYLRIDKVTKLVLGMPGGLCSGQVVSLRSPPLLQSGSKEPDYQWRVTWEGSEQVLGYTEVLRGSGSSFGFTLQPGNYSVEMTATMAGGAVVQGYGNITAMPCIICKSETVVIELPEDSCSAGSELAKQVLAFTLPQETTVDWDSRSVTTPGQRVVSVVATAVTTGATSTCSATVKFQDVTPPVITLLNPTGKCVTPVNSRWMCWKANQLVSLSDNCQSVGSPAFMVRCGEGATADICSIRPDGQACVKAVSDGQLLQLQVLARDGFGNIAEAVNVPIVVKSLADAAGAGCSVAAFESP